MKPMSKRILHNHQEHHLEKVIHRRKVIFTGSSLPSIFAKFSAFLINKWQGNPQHTSKISRPIPHPIFVVLAHCAHFGQPPTTRSQPWRSYGSTWHPTPSPRPPWLDHGEWRGMANTAAAAPTGTGPVQVEALLWGRGRRVAQGGDVDAVAMSFSLGTMGLPKWVAVTHRSLVTTMAE